MFSQLISFKRWHWLLISLLLGMSAGSIFRPKSLDLRTEYGEAINSQKEFETAVVRQVEGRKRFKDIIVHRQSVNDPAGGDRNVWIVNGLYCSNVPDPADGKLHWKPSFFVAVEPYETVIDLSQLINVASPAAVNFQKIASPTVLDFLQLLGETSGVRYSHVWWRSYAMQTWLLGCLLLIGIVWPTAIDLIVFGRLIRPREEKGTDLKASSTLKKPVKPEMSSEDRAKLEALDAAMEASLTEGATSKVLPQSPASAPAVRQLSTEPQQAAPTVAKAPRAFGAGAGDFYPTEQKATSAPKPKT